MRNLRKVLAVVVALVLVLGTALPVMAATDNEVATYAQNLYNLGLYAGVDPNSFVPALDSQLTREQAFVLYAKIMGKAAKASQVTADNIKAYLTDVFVDANQFSDWAKPYATVLIMDKDISGRGDFTMGPQDIITGTELGVLMLKALKVPVDYSTSMNALVTLWKMNVLTFAEMAELNNAQLTRGDAIVIFYKTIANGVINKGEYVAKDLVNKGVMSESSARAIGLLAAYDVNAATNAANAATVAAEAAVTAVETAPYATEADYTAYVTKVNDATTKIAAAPTATQTAFTTRLNVKKALVAAAVSAQVVAATAKVDTYCAITSIANIEASAAAIAKKTDAIATVNLIMDASLRPALLARVEATRAVLEATKLVDITAVDPVTGASVGAISALGDGINQVKLNLQLKDAFGNVLTSAPAAKVDVSTKDGGAVSSSVVTLYNGVGEVLFATDEVEEAKTATVTATVENDNYAAKATDTFKVTMTAESPYANYIDISGASIAANNTDKITLTSKNPIDLTRYVDSKGVIKNNSLTFTGAFTNANVSKITADPSSNKNMIVVFKSTAVPSFVSGEENTITVNDNVDVKESSADFTLTDTQIPYIVSAAIDTTNYKVIKITFSEPVKEIANMKALLNGSLQGTLAVDDSNRKVIKATFASPVEPGSVSITAPAGSVRDFAIAANTNAVQTINFTVAAPSVNFTATTTSYSPKLFTLVTGNTNTFDLTKDLAGAYTKFVVQKYDYDNAEWVDTDMSDYTLTVLSDNKTLVFEANDVTENYQNMRFQVLVKDNALTDKATYVKNDEFAVSLDNAIMNNLDEDAPELVSITPNDGDDEGSEHQVVTLTFSEPIDKDAIDVTFTSLNEDGEIDADSEVIAADSIVADTYRKVFTVTADLSMDTTYQIDITGIEDDMGNEADDISDTIATLETPEVEAAHQLTDVTIVGDAITLTFDKDLAVTAANSTNALYLGNYRYATNAGYAYFTSATIAMTDTNVVVITVTAPVGGVKLDTSTITSIIVSEFMPAADGSTFAGVSARSFDLED